MVLKRFPQAIEAVYPFENDVKKYGTQTMRQLTQYLDMFENDVKKYGTQTIFLMTLSDTPFENDVKKYGTQTVESTSRI